MQKENTIKLKFYTQWTYSSEMKVYKKDMFRQNKLGEVIPSKHSQKHTLGRIKMVGDAWWKERLKW